MQIETLRDVLHRTKAFHQQLGMCLSQCAEENTDDRAQMLLNYLANHEGNLADVINGFAVSSDENALNTWCYEWVNKLAIVHDEYNDVPFAKLNAAQIMSVIVAQHQQVLSLYRYLVSQVSQAVIPSAEEMLASVYSLEQREIMSMVQSVNRFRDM
ncbi:hypothetical protein PTUN_a4180 [Pseudoalteromonas tunicata]|nr:hypothetical protein PTUN_a4180 [Pseudoalteromonas tunicata]AXT31882.1 ATPase [Pseudoalteromonas tunicata]